MGKRGPAPEPTQIKRLKGNPGGRPLNKAEPKPLNEMPRAPSWMSLAAKRQWRRVAKPLHECGLLTKIDGLALAMLCETYAQFIEARLEVEKRGPWFFSEDGKPYVNPAVWVMNKARGEIKGWLREFGMTPSARSGIRMEPAVKQMSLIEELFGEEAKEI